MELEIRPEPPDPVRRAIEAALAEGAGDGSHESPWWRAGVDEALAAEDDQAAWPRRSRGAERA
jgi:hypothetical protein